MRDSRLSRSPGFHAIHLILAIVKALTISSKSQFKISRTIAAQSSKNALHPGILQDNKFSDLCCKGHSN